MKWYLDGTRESKCVHEWCNEGYMVRPTFGCKLDCIIEARAAPARRFVFESLLWLRNLAHPWNEFRLRNEAKLHKQVLSLYLSIYLSIALSFIYPLRQHVIYSVASIHVYAYISKLDENREITAEIQHVRYKCSLYDMIDDTTRHRVQFRKLL